MIGHKWSKDKCADGQSYKRDKMRVYPHQILFDQDEG